jgi:hypothetical protein
VPVYAWQYTDGVLAGPETVIRSRYSGQSDRALLNVKRVSGIAHGFTVVDYVAGVSLHLGKDYDPVTQGISRKDRYLEIRP